MANTWMPSSHGGSTIRKYNTSVLAPSLLEKAAMLNRSSPLAIALQRPLPLPLLSRERFGDRRLYTVVKAERIRLDDIGAHVLVLSETRGSDLQLRNVAVNHAVADLIAGNGQVVGYGTVTTPAGDGLHYSFEGRVTTRPGPDGTPLTTAEGTWTLTSGTGRWQRRVAGGVFLDTVVGPGVSISDWSGTWQTRPSPLDWIRARHAPGFIKYGQVSAGQGTPEGAHHPNTGDGNR